MPGADRELLRSCRGRGKVGRRRFLSGLFLSAALAHGAAPQPIELAVDVRTLQTPPTLFSFARPLVEVDEALLFLGKDGVHGLELWRSDGTLEGTWMVRDTCPGSCDSRAGWTEAPARAGVDGLLFFAAEDGVHGVEPWVTDGTAEGTQLLVDLNPGIGDSAPSWFRWTGDEMLFVADDGLHGAELWSSSPDGSSVSLVADMRPGPEGSGASGLVADGSGAAFFFANDGTHGIEPWMSDGTAEGTYQIVDLVSGADGSASTVTSYPGNPTTIVYSAGRWFFEAGDFELWHTDGTLGNAVRVEDSNGVPVELRYDVASVGSVVYFVGIDSVDMRLWRTDGTQAGTYPLTDPSNGGPDLLGGLVPFAGELFLWARTAAAGIEPWTSDGTMAGTQLLKDVNPGAGDSSSPFTRRASPAGSGLFFFADDGTHGREPWFTDGSAAGTRLVADLDPGVGSSEFSPWTYFPFVGLGDSVLFFAYQADGVWIEPWVTTTDGSGATLFDLDSLASSYDDFSYDAKVEIVGLGAHAVFAPIDDLFWRQAWASGGSAATSSPARTPPVDTDSLVTSSLAEHSASGVVTYVESLAQGGGQQVDRLWRTDGSEAGTFALTDELAQHVGVLATAGHRVFWREGQAQLTDGTTVWPLPPLETVAEVVAFDEALFLLGGSSSAWGLWRSDPPYTSASLIAQHEKDPTFVVLKPTVSGGRLFYAAYDAAAGRELWVSDGTPEGTERVVDLVSGSESSIDVRRVRSPVFGHLFSKQNRFVPLGDGILYVADGGDGLEPWRSDGSEGGTSQVLDLYPGARGSEPLWLTPVGDLVYFVADDGSHGRELWRTDGTAPGTQLLDLVAGEESSAPAWLLDADGVLYFVFTSPDYGVELFRLLEGESTPELVEDLLVGPSSSSPASLTLAGRRLFFYANDGVTGGELRSMVLPTRLPVGELTHSFQPGVVELVLRLFDPPLLGFDDGMDAELSIEIPAELTPLEALASSGSAEISGQSILWNGGLVGDQEIDVVIRLELPASTSVSSWELQGVLAIDTTGDGENDLVLATDDPREPGSADPTIVPAATSALLFRDDFESGLSGWSIPP